MGRGTLDLQINNPRETARVNPELLEAITFGRAPQLDKVVSALREFASGKKAKHFVFVGPRGAGKTHMLMMVKRRIETDAELREALMPVEYPEETYAVMSEADFVRQTVEAVWEVDEHAKAIMGPMPWERERWVFEEGAEAKAVQAGLKGLREYCRASKRSLVLLVDNLDTLLHKASGLENVLKERFLCIVGGAIRPVKRDEFTDLMLEDLSLEDAERLWKRLREFDEEEGLGGSTVVGRACPGPPQDEAGAGAPALQERVEEWWAEVGPRWKAIYEMSGGNPRLLIMLYRAFEEGDVEDVRLELSRLVDESTPYFKAITESLPETDQRVLSAIVHVGERVRPIEIEQATGVEERTLRLSLGRLREAGLVQEQKENGASLYSLRQRFYRTWLRMRMQAGTRYEALWFVDLLRLLYSDPQKWFDARRKFGAEYEEALRIGAPADARRAREMLESLAAAIEDQQMARDWERLWNAGQYGEIARQAEEVQKAAEERGDAALQGLARIAVGLACRQLGHLPKEVQALREAIEIESADPMAHIELGTAYLKSGWLHEAAEKFEDAAALWRKEGRQFRRALAQLYAAGIWVITGDLRRADAQFRDGLRVLSSVAARVQQGDEVLAESDVWADFKEVWADSQELQAVLTGGVRKAVMTGFVTMFGTPAMEAAVRRRWMAVVEGWVEEGIRVMPEAKGFFEPFGWAVDFVVKGPSALARRQDEEVRAVQLILERADLKKEAGEVGKILERRMSGAKEVKPRRAGGRRKKAQEKKD